MKTKDQNKEQDCTNYTPLDITPYFTAEICRKYVDKVFDTATGEINKINKEIVKAVSNGRLGRILKTKISTTTKSNLISRGFSVREYTYYTSIKWD